MLMVNGNGDIEAKLLEDQEEDVENMYSKIEGGKRGVSEEKDCKVVAELERKDEKTGWRLRSWLTGDSKRESKVIVLLGNPVWHLSSVGGLVLLFSYSFLSFHSLHHSSLQCLQKLIPSLRNGLAPLFPSYSLQFFSLRFLIEINLRSKDSRKRREMQEILVRFKKEKR